MKRKRPSSLAKLIEQRTLPRRQTPALVSALLLIAATAIACHFSAFRSQSTGMPPAAHAAIDAFSKDMAEGRYEKIFADAAEEWKKTTTVEQTREFFVKIKEKLGGVKTRTSQTIREQQSVGGEIPGHSIVVNYETAFERAAGMETFTLVERDGRWLLAGYFVNSSALKE
jgi:hypothetical protein